MPSFGALLIAMLTSFLLALALILTRRLHGHLTLDSHAGVQKLHETPTPRIGGVALLFGALVGGIGLPAAAQEVWWLTGLAALPAFAMGLLEDLTKQIGVKLRLFATIFAGLIFCLLTGYGIDRVSIPGADWLLSFGPAALLFTAFAIGGIANAVNIIDGVNGLASGSAIIIFSGMALLCWQAGDMVLLDICLIAIGALCGFFLLNFPMGHIFLGDAGAYSVGFLLAAVSIMLPARNPEFSPLLGLLALSYPVIETMVSIHRRTIRQGSHPGQPDRLHLHSLVYRDLARRLARSFDAPQLRNALTGLILLGLPLLSAVLTVLCARNSALILAGLALMTLIYVQFYRRVALLRTRKDRAVLVSRL